MGKLIKIPPHVGKLEEPDPAFKPKVPKFRYEKTVYSWLKIRTADGEQVARRCVVHCPTSCHRYFEIPASRVSDD